MTASTPSPDHGQVPPSQASDCVRVHRELGIPSDYAVSRDLEFQPEAGIAQLVTLTTYKGRELRLIEPAASAWKKMASAAKIHGIELQPLSGFRSVAQQAGIIRAKLKAGHSLDTILRVSAAPGYSEHHTGRALDIGAPQSPPFDEAFGETQAFRWLTKRASTFGLALSYPPNNRHSIAYEPWHWLWQETFS